MILNEEIYNTEFEKLLFNDISKSYDSVNNFANFRLPVLIRKKILQKLEQHDGELKILDLMSGSGENWGIISKRFPNAEITAIDISEEMTNASKKNGLKYFGSNIKIINNDIFKTELESDYYDLVICSFGIKCLSIVQLETLFVLMKRILKKEGKYLFIEVSKPNNFLFRSILLFHFRYILPLVAGIFHQKYKAYSMLWKYLDNFKIDDVVTIIKKNKLSNNSQYHFYGSIITFNN